MSQQKIFLKAAWRNLLIANYTCNEEILKKYLPAHIELDTFNGQHLISLVAFQFLETKVLGIKFPFHTNFPEVNLRFYVKYNDKGTWKRGVVFIKEIVPKTMITFVANTFFNENYETMSMAQQVAIKQDAIYANYTWGKANVFSAIADTQKVAMKDGSLEEFITEHYWGYAAIDNKSTNEYAVEHPRWLVHNLRDYTIQTNFEAIYGADFALLNNTQPHSVIMACGSDILVRKGRVING